MEALDKLMKEAPVNHLDLGMTHFYMSAAYQGKINERKYPRYTFSYHAMCPGNIVVLGSPGRILMEDGKKVC